MIRDVKCEILCVSKLTNVKVKRWHLMCRWMTAIIPCFGWMIETRFISEKLNRCTRSRLTGSSSIVWIQDSQWFHSERFIHDKMSVPESFTYWKSMSNRYTMHMQLIFTMYGSIWDLQKLWCISYVEYVLYANHQSDFYLREESLRLVDMKHWKWSRTKHKLLVFFLFGLV